MHKIHQRLFWFISIVFTLVFLQPAFAQGGGRTYSKNNHIYTDCAPCAGLIKDYDDVQKDIADVEQSLDEIRRSISVDQQFLQSDDARLSSVESMPPSPKKSEDLNRAQRVKRNDMRDLKNHQETEGKLQEKFYSLVNELDDIIADLEDCEDYYCRPLFHFGLFSHLVNIQMGLMFGTLNSTQTAQLHNSFSDLDMKDFSGSHSQNETELGLQIKFLLGQANKVRPTILLNGEGVLNSSNTLFNARLSPMSDMVSSVKLYNKSIYRALVGAESPIFYDRFSAGIGAGAAVLNQSLNANVAGTWLSTNNTSLAPSLAASITYYACPNCLMGHAFSISGQIAADRYPYLRVWGMNAAGNQVGANVNSKWQFSEKLIFAMDLSKSF